MNKSLVFTNCPVGYRKLTCPNTIATIEIPSDWKVPIIGPYGKTKLVPINSLNKEEAKKINAVKTTKENPNSKWYKGGDDEITGI